jgi:hypothetical protein
VELKKLIHPDTDLRDEIVREVYMLDQFTESSGSESDS